VLTGQSDLFSLGVTLYQLLTARLPFRADSMPALMMKIAMEPHPRIRAMRPDLPEGIDELMDRVLAKDLSERFYDGASLAAELRALARRCQV
jgi:serine/threonine protein kinase